MKKAVILSGGKQYLVSEGETLEVELVKDAKKTIELETLLVIDGDDTVVGKPFVDKAKVTATVVTTDAQGDKVTAIRYKSKKRVHTVRGHRQRHTTIKINKIA